MEKLIFSYWDIKYGFFENWQQDFNFCTAALKQLNKKHITWDFFLRPLRKAYFKDRIKWLQYMKHEAEK